jgi:hypothetical protein
LLGAEYARPAADAPPVFPGVACDEGGVNVRQLPCAVAEERAAALEFTPPRFAVFELPLTAA